MYKCILIGLLSTDISESENICAELEETVYGIVW